MRIGPSLGLTRRGAAGFSPAALFAAGAGGAWYDPADIGTLFQDTAGTVPVTSAGQAVARMLDKSGNGNHATQATAANRPVFQDSGGVRWLEFDGVNDRLLTAAFTALPQPNTVWIAARLNVSPPPALSRLMDGIASGNRHIVDAETAGGYLRQAANVPSIGANNHALPSGGDFVSSHVFNTTVSTIRLENGSVTTGSNGTHSLTGVSLGTDFSGGSAWSGRLHGLVLVAGSAESVWGATMRTWLAARQRRSL